MHFSGSFQKADKVGVQFDEMKQELEILCEMRNEGQG